MLANNCPLKWSLQGLKRAVSGNKLHAGGHQALPSPRLGLQTGPSLVQIHTHKYPEVHVRGQAIEERKTALHVWGQVLFHHLHRETCLSLKEMCLLVLRFHQEKGFEG